MANYHNDFEYRGRCKLSDITDYHHLENWSNNTFIGISNFPFSIMANANQYLDYFNIICTGTNTFNVTLKEMGSPSSTTTNINATTVVSMLQSYLKTGEYLKDHFYFVNFGTKAHLTANESFLHQDETAMFIYQYLSPKKQVTKELKSLDGLSININTIISKKNINVGLKMTDVPMFNYVYIPCLDRYYYVQSESLINDFTTFELVEDVLMSFDSLIRQQTAFVERQENTYNLDIIDNYRSFENECSYTYVELTNTLFDVTSTGTTIGGVNRNLRFVLTVVGDNS